MLSIISGWRALHRFAATKNISAHQLLFLVIVALGLAVPLVLRPHAFFPDDAFFYFQVAQNVAAGNGSTFHGITPTNGYHPLWLLVCSMIFKTGVDKAQFLTLIAGLILGLAIAAEFIYFRIAKSLGFSAWSGGVLLLVYSLSTQLGCEFNLTVLFLMLSVWFYLRGPDETIRWVLLANSIAALAVLSRLDSVFFAMPFALLTIRGFFFPRKKGASLAFLAALVPYLALVGGYLVFNKIQFGHFLTISGAIKSHFPHFRFSPGNLSRFGWFFVAAALCAMPLIASAWEGKKQWASLAFVTCIGTIMQGLYIVGFMSGITTWTWYYAMGLTSVLLTLPMWFQAAQQRMKLGWLQGVTFFCLALFALYYTHRSWAGAGYLTGRHQHTWQVEVAAWAETVLPAGSRIFIWDYPGAVGYFASGLSFFPLDGLINDYESNIQLVKEGPIGYAKKEHIGYYIGKSRNPNEDSIVEVVAPLTGLAAGKINLRASMLVGGFKEATVEPVVRDVYIWRIDVSDAHSGQ